MASHPAWFLGIAELLDEWHRDLGIARYAVFPVSDMSGRRTGNWKMFMTFKEALTHVLGLKRSGEMSRLILSPPEGVDDDHRGTYRSRRYRKLPLAEEAAAAHAFHGSALSGVRPAPAAETWFIGREWFIDRAGKPTDGPWYVAFPMDVSGGTRRRSGKPAVESDSLDDVVGHMKKRRTANRHLKIDYEPPPGTDGKSRGLSGRSRVYEALTLDEFYRAQRNL